MLDSGYERYVDDGGALDMRMTVFDAFDSLIESDGCDEILSQMLCFFSTDALSAFVSWYVDMYTDSLPTWLVEHWSIRECIANAELHCDGRNF